MGYECWVLESVTYRQCRRDTHCINVMAMEALLRPQISEALVGKRKIGTSRGWGGSVT